jgi:hypothetical protein
MNMMILVKPQDHIYYFLKSYASEEMIRLSLRRKGRRESKERKEKREGGRGEKEKKERKESREKNNRIYRVL